VSWWTLPENWDTAHLGDLVRIKSGFACAKKNLVPAGEGVAHLRPFNVGTNGEMDLSEVYYIPPNYKDNIENYALEPGHVLFNNTNSVELVGKTALVTEPMQCAFSNHIYRLTVKDKAKGRLEPAWLTLVLRRLWAMRYFAEYCNRWIGQAGFNSKMLKDVEIPIPPLDEQRRIVARIEELFARIEEAQRLRAAADEDTDRLLDAAMTGVFSEQILSHWETMPLKHLAKIEAKLVDPTLPEYRDLPHINGNVIESGTCRLLPYNTAAEDGMTSSKYLFAPDDVLYSKIRPYLRKATRVDFKGVCSADMYPLTVTDERLNPHFLMWSLVAPPFTNYAADRSGRARMPKLNRRQLFSYPFPLPSLDEQRRIVEYLDDVQAQVVELKCLQADSAAELERLRGAVLARAFRGEL
jgi:type I restriction enzyme S subunit